MAELTSPGQPADPRAVRVEVAQGDRRPGDEPMVVTPTGPEALPRLERSDTARAVLHAADGSRRVLFGEVARGSSGGRTSVEVVVDGWRVQLELEPERRAALRERAGHHRGAGSAGGPLELRAIIPGRVVSVSVVPGDEVSIGQQLLVIEAMKMQNELRATKAGRIGRIAVGAGQTIEVGDLLLVLE
jgi:biotin carboxyl carrier protein